ncbi:BT_3987 domain-containing protein [Pedobacter frigoris]|uniref:BT_3987 domain-containing protein n=1 Tax=Pedobacter frigoris TaxID=2571272 RepID=UPI00292E3407|nr:DUF1735 domain-containing protein [Pedobacter frigoris]
MKSSIIFRNKYTALFVLAASMFVSCSKEKTFDFNGDSVNRVYFNIGSYTVKNYNGYAFSIKHTPIGSIGDDIKAAFPARITQEAAENVKVSYAIDNSLIQTYNAEKGTNYVAVPAGILDVSTAELTIPQGRMNSTDSLKVAVPKEKMSQLTAAGYLVPLKITSVNGAKNTEVSTNANTVYVVISTKQTNLYDAPVAADITGTLNAVRTGWTATLDATLSSGSLPNMFDAGTNTSWYITPAKSVNLVVNMNGSITGITAVRFHTSSTNYYLTTANVSTSADGVTWVSQGAATFSIINAYQYIKFYAPVTARYIKLEVTGWRSGSARIMFTDFNIYR